MNNNPHQTQQKIMAEIREGLTAHICFGEDRLLLDEYMDDIASSLEEMRQSTVEEERNWVIKAIKEAGWITRQGDTRLRKDTHRRLVNLLEVLVSSQLTNSSEEEK